MSATKPVAPTAAQKAWMNLGYGMFLHFGPNTYQGVGWGDGSFPAKDVDLRDLDVAQWAGMAAEAGMKYAVLTAKHHDGFCLWPSEHTDYCVKNAPGNKDVVGLFVKEFRKAGLKPGLYYSLWDRSFKRYEDDAAYNEYMLKQMTELLTRYGDIVELYFDGAWDKDYPTRSWKFNRDWLCDPKSGYTPGTRWGWEALYRHIHKLQPAIIVMNNPSSDRPGEARYLPMDARNSEHFDFIYQGRKYEASPDNVCQVQGQTVYLPLEYNADANNANWFWSAKQFYLHPSCATLCDWYRRARAIEANLLLNIGPTSKGVLPEYHRPYLKAAARELFG